MSVTVYFKEENEKYRILYDLYIYVRELIIRLYGNLITFWFRCNKIKSGVFV